LWLKACVTNSPLEVDTPRRPRLRPGDRPPDPGTTLVAAARALSMENGRFSSIHLSATPCPSSKRTRTLRSPSEGGGTSRNRCSLGQISPSFLSKPRAEAAGGTAVKFSELRDNLRRRSSGAEQHDHRDCRSERFGHGDTTALTGATSSVRRIWEQLARTMGLSGCRRPPEVGRSPGRFVKACTLRPAIRFGRMRQPCASAQSPRIRGGRSSRRWGGPAYPWCTVGAAAS
jgi:hypothetical protein